MLPVEPRTATFCGHVVDVVTSGTCRPSVASSLPQHALKKDRTTIEIRAYQFASVPNSLAYPIPKCLPLASTGIRPTPYNQCNCPKLCLVNRKILGLDGKFLNVKPCPIVA